MEILEDLFRIFFPELCANCENHLTKNEEIVCTFCRHDMPLTDFLNYSENKITKTFYGRIPLEKATALLYFRKKASQKNLFMNLNTKEMRK